jgi:RimJ/RimL family protein N-acetyltransferase
VTGSKFTLVRCDEAGKPVAPTAALPDALAENCAATAALFANIGYNPPWVGYIAIADATPVGGGAFVGAPRDGCVEIAYFTLEAFEGLGNGGNAAAALVDIAREADLSTRITAKTLREDNPSVKILRGWASSSSAKSRTRTREPCGSGG